MSATRPSLSIVAALALALALAASAAIAGSLWSAVSRGDLPVLHLGRAEP